MLAALIGDFAADGEGLFKIACNVCNRVRVIEIYRILIVQIQTAEVHIHRADHGVAVIGQAHLGVDKARPVLVDAHARLCQHLIIGARHGVHVPLVGHARRDDAHVNAGLGRVAQGLRHLVVENEIRRHDAHGLLRAHDELLIDGRAHVLVVKRAVGKRLQIPVRLTLRCGIERAEGIHILLQPGHGVPVGEEHHRHRPNGLAPDQNAAVFPVPVRRGAVDVLVGQIHASCERGLPVDNHELAVVAVVEPAREHRNVGREGVRLNAHFAQLLAVAARQARDAAKIVIQHAHIHALKRLLLQDLQNGVPHLPGRDDKEFQKDVVPRLFQLLEHLCPAVLAAGKILRAGVVVDGVAGAAQQKARMVERRVRRTGERLQRVGILAQMLQNRQFALRPLMVPAVRGLVAAEEDIDRQSRHGERQNQHDPRDFIRRIAAPGHDADDQQPRQHVDDRAHPEAVFLQPQHTHQQKGDLQ